MVTGSFALFSALEEVYSLGQSLTWKRGQEWMYVVHACRLQIHRKRNLHASASTHTAQSAPTMSALPATSSSLWTVPARSAVSSPVCPTPGSYHSAAFTSGTLGQAYRLPA